MPHDTRACAPLPLVAMNVAMPTPALLQAMSRLDQAVTRAETALAHAGETDTPRHQARETMIRQAIGELDGLISTLQEKSDG